MTDKSVMVFDSHPARPYSIPDLSIVRNASSVEWSPHLIENPSAGFFKTKKGSVNSVSQLLVESLFF